MVARSCLVSSDKTIKVWDAVTGAVICTLEGHTAAVTSVSFNRDGSQIVSG
jgi:WD40 repeat protein